MEKRVFDKLEFDQVRSLLAAQAAYAGGKELAMQCRPERSFEMAQRRQEETAEAFRLLQLAGEPPFGGVRELREVVEKAAVGALLTPDVLLSLSQTLQATARIKLYLKKHGPSVSAPQLMDLGESLGEFSELIQTIDRCIDHEGNVVDRASPALAAIRSKLRRARRRVRESLDSLVRSPKGQRILQEGIVTIRDGRFVVPVKQQFRGEIDGIVHDQSGSGATLFIEPMIVVQMNNEIRRAELKEREEIERILRQLSGHVGALAQDIHHSLELLAELDLIFARGRLALRWDGIRPKLNRENRLLIVGGRHPLLRGHVVPIDVELGTEWNALVITGPNTGGKTVTLKTVGLFALMAQAGLHLPAEEGTEMPFLGAVYADIGDEQSIEQNLSTFSSHMRQVVRIVEQADERSLVLLDELGAGTDPTEGSALAIAILEHLIRRGSLIVATTHYSELKGFAYTFAGAKNASVEFDVETLKPTYRLAIGVAGSSNAFAIAERLGLNKHILARARQELTESEAKVEDAIRSVERDMRLAARDRREAEKLKERYEKLSERYEVEYERLKQQREAMLAEAREESARIVAQAKRESEDLLGRLRRAGTKRLEEEATQVRRHFQQLEKEFERDEVEAPPKRTASLVNPQPGMVVKAANLNQEGEIVQVLPDGKVTLQVGAMRLTVAEEDLIPVRSSSSAQPKTNRGPRMTQAGSVTLSKATEIKPELHVRGMLVEEALEQLDKYLDDAVLAGVDRVRIVHGKGTGRLREAVKVFLNNDTRVKNFRLADVTSGGTGVTEVEL